MDEKRRWQWRKLLLATAGVAVFNLLLNLTLTNVTPNQIGKQAINWNGVFYAREISALMYAIYVLSLFRKTADFGKRLISFVMTHINVIFLCIIFAYLVLYEFYFAYFTGCDISPDSSYYMREASALLAGNGFHVDKLAGYDDSWFSSWPIGYPALIAAATFLSGRSVYLGSKLLSIVLVGLGIFVLHLRFKKDAWIFSLIYLNTGFLKIYRYTWSENPFIFSLLIWGIALSAIVEESIPRRRWYVIAVLGIMGAFLSRYFGIVTILFTAFCLLTYVCIFIKKRNASAASKIKGLLCVEVISSLLTGCYLLMNRMMSGRISGVNRLEWKDDYNDLVNNLYNALMEEFFYATKVDIESFLPQGLSLKGKAWIFYLLLAVLVILLFRNFQKERKLDYKTVFIGAGVFYYFVFIIVRFYSSMDAFGYRFFAPGGILISVGVLGMIKDKFSDNLKKIQIFMCLFLAIPCISFVHNIKRYTIETSVYHEIYNQMMQTTACIPPKGMILNGHYFLRAFRPDVMSDVQIGYNDTLETITARFDSSNSIWIQRSVLNAIVANENYLDEIRNTFLQYVEEGADELEYIQVN